MRKKSDLSAKKLNVVIKAANLFFRKGYVNTGLNEILKKCGIAKGTFYYYFGSKDELLLAVIDYHSNRINHLFNEVVNDLSIYKLKSFFSIFLHTIAIVDIPIEDFEDDEITENTEIKENDEISLFDAKNSELNTVKFYGGSPIGNINSELSNLSDSINKRIKKVYFNLDTRIFAFLKMLSNTDKNYIIPNPDFYTYLLINSLEGVCLKLKREQNEKPIDEFLNFFDLIIEQIHRK